MVMVNRTGIRFISSTDGSIDLTAASPFKANLFVGIRMTETRSADVFLTDITALKVATIFTGSLSRGQHSLQYNAFDLPAGVYILSLQIDGQKKISIPVVHLL